MILQPNAELKDSSFFYFSLVKNFLYLVTRHKKENEATKFLFLGGRRGQGIEDMTRNINKPKMTLLEMFYKPFVFKPIECMDTIRVVRFLHYKSMMRVSCFKPLFFSVNELSLYLYNIVGILIKLIFFREVFFSIIITMFSLPGC